MRVLRLAAGHDPRAIAARVVFVCLGAGQRFLRAVLHLRVAGIGVGMLRKATLRLHGAGRKGRAETVPNSSTTARQSSTGSQRRALR